MAEVIHKTVDDINSYISEIDTIQNAYDTAVHVVNRLESEPTEGFKALVKELGAIVE